MNNTSFNGKALSEDLEMLIDLAADGLRNPSFAPEYFERLRSQFTGHPGHSRPGYAEMASLLFDRYLFPDHPYGNPLDGFPATIQAIQRDDLIQFHKVHYSPKDMIIVVTGAVTPERTFDLVERYFSDWQPPRNKALKELTLPLFRMDRSESTASWEEKSQADLLMGSLAPRRTSEDYLPVYLGNNILGQFGLMGRIGESVRSRSGLAYYASSSISAWADTGTWEFSAGTNPDNLEKTIDLIRAEIKRYVTAPVTAEELEDSKSNLIGRLPLLVGIQRRAGERDPFHRALPVRPGLLPALRRSRRRHQRGANPQGVTKIPRPGQAGDRQRGAGR
jgi:zinc protease